MRRAKITSELEIVVFGTNEKLSDKFVVERMAGSLRKYVPKDKLDKDWKEVREETQKIVAREIADECK